MPRFFLILLLMGPIAWGQSPSNSGGDEMFKNVPKTKKYSFGDTLNPPDFSMKYGERFNWERDFPRFSEKFRREFETFKDEFRGLPGQLSDEFQSLNREILQASGFSNVNVFTNKPNNNVVNVGFKALNEGTITVSFVDTKGEVVLKETLKDFTGGEYMGQFSLKKGSKGTFFVIIGQNENGVSRKIKIE